MGDGWWMGRENRRTHLMAQTLFLKRSLGYLLKRVFCVEESLWHILPVGASYKTKNNNTLVTLCIIISIVLGIFWSHLLILLHRVQQSQMGKKEISAASKTVHTCTKCKKDFLTEGRLKKHRCSACESCGKVLSSYQRLLGHSCQQQDDDNNDEYSIESDEEKSDSNKSIRSLVQNQDVAKWGSSSIMQLIWHFLVGIFWIEPYEDVAFIASLKEDFRDI